MGRQDGNAPWFRVSGYRMDGVRYQGSAFMDTDLRLARVDQAGIHAQVLSPNPLTFVHHIPAADAQRFCESHNDALAQVVQRHPIRLSGNAALPVQDPARAVAELERAVADLGLLADYIGTDMPHRLDDPVMGQVYYA